ncbi:MAG: hypothetical protein KAJ34_07575, partial [Thermodesulfovibrionia bacterium]|nr:hypothetical protein [Thermodesulfovibrionia bacterium]
MRILLIGNFAPPYEEESLHNLHLLKRLQAEKHDCSAINISKNPSQTDSIVNGKNFIDFVFKVLRYGWKKDIIHISTKGYTRLGLMKIMVSVVFSKVFFARSIVTLHSELYSIFGQIRSKVGGEQAIYLAFALAHKIIFGDRDTHDIAYSHKVKDNFALIPLFMDIPDNISENERRALKKLENKKKIILFSNVVYPSLIFDVLSKILTLYPRTDIGIAVSFIDKFPAKLQHVIEEAGQTLKENIIFINSDNNRLLSIAYAKANLVLRTMSCDGSTFFQDIALILRKPEHSANCLYFPTSFLMLKEGDVSSLYAHMVNNLLLEKTEEFLEPSKEDFYEKIKDIYFK